MERRIDYLPIDEVEPADLNPKRHADESIRQSMDRFGYTEPAVLDERTGKLVAGHGRLEALRALRKAGAQPPEGVSEDWSMPVLRGWKSKNDEEAAAYLVASNRLTELGGWDSAELFGLLDQLDDLDGVGFNLEQLDDLAKEVAAGSPDFSPVGVDELPRLDQKHPITCPECGHQWQKD